MKLVMRTLAVALMGAVLSLAALAPTSAFGQKNNNRPPKDPEKVKQPDKQPRGNSNTSGNRNRP